MKRLLLLILVVFLLAGCGKEEPVVEQLEFPVVDDADIPAEWE